MPERYKQRITYLLILLTTLPFVFAVKHPKAWSLDPDNIISLARYVSSISGFVGIALLVWMYVLGTRTVTGLFYKDIPWTLWLHRTLGKYGTLAVFAHPFLSSYVYGENVLRYWLSPSFDGEFATHVTYGRAAFIYLLIVWFSSVYLRKRIAYRPWKYLHYLAYASLPLALLHTREIGSSMDIKWTQFYYYTFVLMFFVVSILRLRYLFGYGKLSYQVIENNKLNGAMHKLVLKPSGKAVLPMPGQYVYVQLKLLGEEHPFSVVHTADDGTITLIYKVYGSYTRKLSVVKESAYVYLDGPYGKFTHDISEDPSIPSVFLAAGVGVTPFIHHIVQLNHPDRVLFYSLRSKEDSVFDKTTEKNLGKRLIYIESGGKGGGRLTADMFTKHISKPSSYMYYVCGPKSYIEDVESMLKKLGVEDARIHSEKFSF